MADNSDRTPGTGEKVAADEATYSGDTAKVQLVRLVHVTGTEGSKTVSELIKAEDSASADGDFGIPMLAVRQATPANTSGTDGDYEPLRMSGGRLWASATVDAALPAGNNNIGDVDVASMTPGTAAANLGKAEDAAHADADVGVMMLAVRNYAGAGADGDYSAINVNEEGDVVTEVRQRMVRVSVQSAGLTIATTAYTAGDQVGTQFTIAGAARASGGFGYITGVTLISAADIIGAYDVVVTRASVTLAADNAAYAISDADALNVVSVIQLSGAFDIGNNRIAQAQNLRIPYDCSGGTSLFAGLITRSAHTFFGAVGDLQLIFHLELA